MGVLDIFRRETRESAENPNVPVSASNFLKLFGMDDLVRSAAGVSVNTETALGVPAVWAAVNFISGTLAGLPLQVYRKNGEGREKVSGGLATILHDAVNDEMSSFEWRKGLFDNVFTGGRAFSFIERSAINKVMNLWPLDPGSMSVRRENGRKVYVYKDGGRELRYTAGDILDIPFMLKSDGVSHRGPIAQMADVIGLAIAATRYGSKFFQNGGVPPFVVTGPFQSGAAMSRAADDLAEAVRKAAREERQALTLPTGLDVKPIGADPEKTQLVELQRFIIEQVARIYSLPPTFLQDLSHGTYSNTEQQDLHFVKHTLKRWCEQFEQELNLKLFGRSVTRQYVELNLDGLLRGDFKTRMEGYALAVQNGLRTPNEIRETENWPANPDGDRLMIQGATVPISSQPTEPQAPVAPPAPVDENARAINVNVEGTTVHLPPVNIGEIQVPDVRFDLPPIVVPEIVVPEPQVHVTVAPPPPPPPRRMRTVVREHDAQGRIKAFDQEELP